MRNVIDPKGGPLCDIAPHGLLAFDDVAGAALEAASFESRLLER